MSYPLLHIIVFYSLALVFFMSANLEQSKQAVPADTIKSGQESNEYNLIIYPAKEHIPIAATVKAFDNYNEAVVDGPSGFLYFDDQRMVRAAVLKSGQWHTWEVYDASESSFTAKLLWVDFDGEGSGELYIMYRYGLTVQSTFGESYSGAVQLWDIDRALPYSEVKNYEYGDDMGRNGDQTYRATCFSEVTVSPGGISVAAPSYRFEMYDVNGDEMTDPAEQVNHEYYDQQGCKEYLNKEIGEYQLRNGVVEKI